MSEAAGLHLEDLDLDNGVIHVRRSVWNGHQRPTSARGPFLGEIGPRSGAEQVVTLPGYECPTSSHQRRHCAFMIDIDKDDRRVGFLPAFGTRPDGQQPATALSPDRPL
jgi:hypothetical protein